MLYLSLKDRSLVAIQTKKTVFSGEKIVSSAYRELPEGIIVNGLVVDFEKFKKELENIFSSGYPKRIFSKEVSLAISNKQVFVERLSLYGNPQEESFTDLVIEEAKKVLSSSPQELVNFYKILGKDSEGEKVDILYTAMAKHVLAHFGKFMKMMGMKLSFLIPESFAIFRFINSLIGEKEKILYISLDKNSREYLVFDIYGPIFNFSKKGQTKNFILEAKEILESLVKKHKTEVGKIVVGGIESIELSLVETSESLGKPLVKVKDLIGKTEGLKFKFETGGIPQILFTETWGLILASKSLSFPNFAEDLKSIDISYNYEEELQRTKEKEKEELSKIGQEEFTFKQKKWHEPLVIIESHQSFLGQFLNLKWLSVLILFGVILFAGFFFVFLKPDQLGFRVSPAVTSTPIILSPSPTPLLGVNPLLKRENLRIKVENGTKKVGYAKATATFLEEKGYQKVAIGNADKDNYELSVIKIKNSKKDYLSFILSDLEGKLNISNIQKKEIEEGEDFDVIIILGAS